MNPACYEQGGREASLQKGRRLCDIERADVPLLQAAVCSQDAGLQAKKHSAGSFVLSILSLITATYMGWLARLEVCREQGKTFQHV